MDALFREIGLEEGSILERTEQLEARTAYNFQFPLRDNELMRYEKRSLVYHEAVPGHHFQLALITENKELPRFMQMRAFGGNSAITEGWALYAERLADEAGWYEGDIESRIGYLDSMLFRARRLVVDTGLHAALGEQFSLQQFHNVVLGAGVVPLTMLEDIVGEYITAAGA